MPALPPSLPPSLHAHLLVQAIIGDPGGHLRTEAKLVHIEAVDLTRDDDDEAAPLTRTKEGDSTAQRMAVCPMFQHSQHVAQPLDATRQHRGRFIAHAIL